MFRYSINNISKLNNKQFKRCFTNFKCANQKIINFNSTTAFKSTSLSTTAFKSTSTASVSNINNNFKSLFNNNRFYSTNNNSNSNNSSNNNESSNNNNNNNNNNEFNNNEFNKTEFLNRNKKRILYSMGIVGMGIYSMFGGNDNNNNNNNNDEIKQTYYEFFGFKVKERDLVIGSIIVANAIVFALLKNNAFFNRFAPHFFCSPQTVQIYPASIVLSTFTHTEVLHFGFNMYALYNFGGVCYDHMGFRDFMLLYLFGGLVGSMTSLTTKLITGAFEIPSIGASGSILSIVGASVFLEQGQRLSIMFLPFSFESISFVHALLLFDLMGVLIKPLGRLTGWDHACHFGSTLFGYAIGSSYQYKERFQNFNGYGKIINDRYIYNGSIKNGKFSGVGEYKDSMYSRRGAFKDGSFVAGEVTHLKSGQTRVFRQINNNNN